jgi:hypothetical protein
MPSAAEHQARLEYLKNVLAFAVDLTAEQRREYEEAADRLAAKLDKLRAKEAERLAAEHPDDERRRYDAYWARFDAEESRADLNRMYRRPVTVIRPRSGRAARVATNTRRRGSRRTASAATRGDPDDPDSADDADIASPATFGGSG